MFHITIDSSSYSDLVDSRITTNFHTYIWISHLYIHYNIFITTNRTVNWHWKIGHKLIFAITITFLHGKIIHDDNDWIFIVVNSYYCYQVYNNRRKYRRLPAMTDCQLTANNHWRLFGVYSWPAAGDIYTGEAGVNTAWW